ncbi:PREDICTED: scarecrow-like protein 30 [Tarenaya hassleriana]|uniref:scarecrow-like protein 30 n=1 Tax=Tarenaya hassleriana TaxID=28532 RepID=UPI00053C4439|nr:PREDICTED: scarecrow-like protein 30 [Tarenaya hassleriana]
MDALLEVSIDEFRFENGSGTCCNPMNSSLTCFRKAQHDNPPPPSGDSPVCLEDFPVLSYINHMLMEEDLDCHHSFNFHDSSALQAAERSFYEALHDQSDQTPGLSDQSDNFTGNFSTASSSHQPASGLTGSPESVLYGESQRRYHRRDDDSLENGRTKKQPAISFEMEMAEKFEDVLLLCTGRHHDQESSPHSPENQSHKNRAGRAKGSSNRSRRLNPEPVDLRNLLMQCAQAVASFDNRTATEKLKEIRSHSERHGNGMQRLAFYFAEGLEARFAGSPETPPVFYPHPCVRTSMVDTLNAYKVMVQACPINKMSYHVANKTIFQLASKATRLHIIDFGILYGFQWACLIQALSNRPGGPPLLRITGIELPQRGFHPSERAEETGRRLKRFCDRFNIPFEYSFIAKKWETISLDELVIDREETAVVNCLYRLRYTPDETVSMNSPRDMVLKLFRDINPDLFVFGEVNGMYNSPFFVSRFREALFHFSTIFDMIETTMQAEDEYRTLLEKELFMRDAVNVIACEGAERVDRPETYKQWQVRTMRAGFKPVKLSREITEEAAEMVRKGFHRDFVIDTDNHWLFQGWKGRVIHALSCWKPA